MLDVIACLDLEPPPESEMQNAEQSRATNSPPRRNAFCLATLATTRRPFTGRPRFRLFLLYNTRAHTVDRCKGKRLGHKFYSLGPTLTHTTTNTSPAQQQQPASERTPSDKPSDAAIKTNTFSNFYTIKTNRGERTHARNFRARTHNHGFSFSEHFSPVRPNVAERKEKQR